jgi:hypothetical protein
MDGGLHSIRRGPAARDRSPDTDYLARYLSTYRGTCCTVPFAAARCVLETVPPLPDQVATGSH